MTASGVRVRAARPADAEALARVHVASWQWAYRGIVPDAVLDALSWQERRDQWQERLGGDLDPQMRTWVAVGSGTAAPDDRSESAAGSEHVVGFASFGPSRDDDTTATTAELYAIYVAPHQARRGAGRALLRTGVKALPAEFERLDVWVLADNVPARRFYARHGLAPDGMEKTLDIGGAQLVEVRCSALVSVVRERLAT